MQGAATGSQRDIRGVIVLAQNAAEAAVVEGVDVIAVNFVSDAVGFLTDELPLRQRGQFDHLAAVPVHHVQEDPFALAGVERLIGSIRRECLDHVIAFD